VSALAPFLTCDPDPYIVLGNDSRLSWIMDALTISDSYPYFRHYRLDRNLINYMRNSVKAVVDANDGTTTFYVLDKEDPVIAVCRRMFPSLFKDPATMPPPSPGAEDAVHERRGHRLLCSNACQRLSSAWRRY
jgi:uncharacterized protein